MIEEYCRHHYQKVLVDPIANCLSSQIKPDQITWLSGLFGMLVLPALLFHHVMLAITLLLLSGYCDNLDGTMARIHNNSSHWGSVLDITIDRLVEWIVVFALWCLEPNERGIWCLLML